MPSEHLIQEILSRNSGISREEINERLKHERNRTNGFITDETLLRMIAAELGVTFLSNETVLKTLSVADLVPSLNNVTVVGRVVAVFPPKTFNGRRSGRFASFLIADMSGILRVVLWNDKVSVVESGLIQTGRVVRISRGYTKEGSGAVELHVGEKCKLEADPQDAITMDFPTIRKFAANIDTVVHGRKNAKVTVIGTVERAFEPSTFERQDSTSGKVMRLILSDESGQIPVVFWNEKVDEVEPKLAPNNRLVVVCGKLRVTKGVAEIHVDSGTYIELVREEDEFTKVEGVRDKQRRINIEGQVITKPVTREVTTFKDEVVKVTSFELEDDTGRIWVSAWRDQADAVKDLNVGAKIVLKNAYVRKGFGDQPEISTQSTTSIVSSRDKD
jgi:ssDNA-binding replication factor A large subunit